MSLRMGVWQGVAMDPLKFHPNPPWPCSTLLRSDAEALEFLALPLLLPPLPLPLPLSALPLPALPLPALPLPAKSRCFRKRFSFQICFQFYFSFLKVIM
jgi:hypothetical protein